jgi:hypothetical protein
MIKESLFGRVIVFEKVRDATRRRGEHFIPAMAPRFMSKATQAPARRPPHAGKSTLPKSLTSRPESLPAAMIIGLANSGFPLPDSKTVDAGGDCFGQQGEQQRAKFASPESEPRKSSVISLPRGAIGEWNGVIGHLREGKGNVHTWGIVGITANSPPNERKRELRNVLDLTTDSEYLSENMPGQYVTLDFGEKRVIMTAYQLRSAYLRSWVIKAGMDLDNLEEVDRQENFTGFKTLNTRLFDLAASTRKCRFIQLCQTGQTSWGNDYLSLRGFEVFGLLGDAGEPMN